MLTLLEVVKRASSAAATAAPADIPQAHKTVGQLSPNKALPWQMGRRPKSQPAPPVVKASNYNDLGGGHDYVTGGAGMPNSPLSQHLNRMIGQGLATGNMGSTAMGSSIQEAVKKRKGSYNYESDRPWYQRYWKGLTDPWDTAEEYSKMTPLQQLSNTVGNAAALGTAPAGLTTSLLAEHIPTYKTENTGAIQTMGAIGYAALHPKMVGQAISNNITGRLDTSELPDYQGWRSQSQQVDTQRRALYDRMRANPANQERARTLFPEYTK